MTRSERPRGELSRSDGVAVDPVSNHPVLRVPVGSRVHTRTHLPLTGHGLATELGEEGPLLAAPFQAGHWVGSGWVAMSNESY